ncbi:uncharacterized protein LOC131417811 isoform X2 [Diceros bicornis minor]|uniref:uncharacterized protein LOC131417811 isoform X2 n=1 Tax=Diceros bicornis minor TaxID=77932 RepID=UPI0026ECBCFF|nr:uncharacterized protein LOC131417811 isoform X2 [Diceros bicornis minor]
MLRRLARTAAQWHGALWARGSGSWAGVPAHVVDLRSDTVTKPGPAMRRAMAEAVVGDDDYGEDPTVRELQEKAVELLGVEQTLFVPTNTMANLISVMCHCRRRGSQLLLGQECHLHVYEQGGVAQVRTQLPSPGASGGCSALLVGTCFPGRASGWAEGRNGWDGGLSRKAGRRDVPRLSTRGQPRLRSAVGTVAMLGALLPPSGHSGHQGRGTATSPEHTEPVFLPLLTWDVCAQVHSTRGRLQGPELGGAERTEVGGAAGPLDLILHPPQHLQIAGVHSHPLPDLPHGTLDLAELERMVTRGLGSPYHPVCELICLENTHSSSGGRVLPINYLRQVRLLARSYGVRVHLDGARLMNASVALHVPPARIVEHCDSVSLCFSKVGSRWAAPQTQEGGVACSRRLSWVPGLLCWQPLIPLTLPQMGPPCPPFPIPFAPPPPAPRTETPTQGAEEQDSLLSSSQGLGAPVGALVGGPKDFIEEAWRLRKALGGGMRQAGVLAAAALVGLADAEEVLLRDHRNAQRFAKGPGPRAPGTGVAPLLRGSHGRGDEHGDGEGGRAAARGAVPAPAGRECR